MTPTPSATPPQPAAFAYAQAHAESIRRLISKRLGPRIRRIVDTADVEQSLLKSLLHVEVPQTLTDEELRRLVTAIALRKLFARVRKEHVELWATLPEEPAGSGSTLDPAEEASDREALEIAHD